MLSLGVAGLFSSSCSSCPPTDSRCNAGVGGGGGSGGGGGGGGFDPYDRFVLDSKFSDRFYMDLVVDQTAGKSRVGVAYVAGRGEIPIVYLPGDAGIASEDGGSSQDAGVYEIRYVEWENGAVKTPQVVDAVSRMVGISIDFSPTTNEPAIAYLGGGSDMSLYWFNSDAELAVRSGGTTWAKEASAINGFQVTCGNAVSDQAAGVVVGIWPAIKYQSNGTLWYCYRDVHTGQYPQGDWGGADVECLHGSPGSWTRECAYPGGNTKDAPGGRIRLTMANDVPTVLWDHATGGADTRGTDVEVQSHLPAGGWSVKFNALRSGDTQNGGTIDWDPTEGLGVAALDLTDGVLRYTNKATGSAQWSTADPVVGEGTGGWYPSLAMDPVNHEPAIAFYVCSTRSGQNSSQCQPDFDEVRVTQRINNDWASHTEVVDTVSATMVKMGFLPDGRKVIAYRERNGTVHLAVRKSAQ
ncbi:MAG: hypothetical protein IPJ65_27770 [Archangiaceae bacterium]|nr:hypothetical protein [Archangiaceae bacterium]